MFSYILIQSNLRQSGMHTIFYGFVNVLLFFRQVLRKPWLKMVY